MNLLNYRINCYHTDDQKEVIDFITSILEELDLLEEVDLKFNPQLDSDLFHIKKEYIKTGGVFYVVRDGNKIIGTSAIKKETDNIASLRRLYVLSAYREKGLGKRLTQKCINFCNQNKFKKIILDTTTNNKRAILFFKKLGFRKLKQEGIRLYFEKELL